jgi:hypothetical protein
MCEPKEITGVLYFSDEEPRIIGHLEIAGEHFELVGLKRSVVRTDITGRQIGKRRSTEDNQGDLFDEAEPGKSV